MTDNPSRFELDHLYQTVRDGFAGVNARLDILNGRTREGEIGQSENEQRLGALEFKRFGAKETGLLTLAVALIAAVVKGMELAYAWLASGPHR